MGIIGENASRTQHVIVFSNPVNPRRGNCLTNWAERSQGDGGCSQRLNGTRP